MKTFEEPLFDIIPVDSNDIICSSTCRRECVDDNDCPLEF